MDHTNLIFSHIYQLAMQTTTVTKPSKCVHWAVFELLMKSQKSGNLKIALTFVCLLYFTTLQNNTSLPSKQYLTYLTRCSSQN